MIESKTVITCDSCGVSYPNLPNIGWRDYLEKLGWAIGVIAERDNDTFWDLCPRCAKSIK